MADLATLQTRLTEAETALHNLIKGVAVVEVRRDGRMVKYNAGNKADLSSYADWLRGEIARLEGVSSGSLPRRRFIPVSMG